MSLSKTRSSPPSLGRGGAALGDIRGRVSWELAPLERVLRMPRAWLLRRAHLRRFTALPGSCWRTFLSSLLADFLCAACVLVGPSTAGWQLSASLKSQTKCNEGGGNPHGTL